MQNSWYLKTADKYNFLTQNIHLVLIHFKLCNSKFKERSFPKIEKQKHFRCFFIDILNAVYLRLFSHFEIILNVFCIVMLNYRKTPPRIRIIWYSILMKICVYLSKLVIAATSVMCTVKSSVILLHKFLKVLR